MYIGQYLYFYLYLKFEIGGQQPKSYGLKTNNNRWSNSSVPHHNVKQLYSTDAQSEPNYLLM
jgi:hypothetical protein